MTLVKFWLSGFLLSILITVSAIAAPTKMKFSFVNTDLAEMVSAYSKATGQKFVVDSSVRGKATIASPGEVTPEEAMNLLSNALKVNDFAIVQQEGVMNVIPARKAIMGQLPVVSQLPSATPERLLTYVVTLQAGSADDFNKNMRMLSSSHGSLLIMGKNKLVITDWISTLYKIDQVIKEYESKTTKF